MFNTHRTYSLTTGMKGKTIAVVGTSIGVSVLYHNTIVVKANEAKRAVTLDMGGWDTVSTRYVINRALEQLYYGCGVFLERVKGVTMLNIKGKRVPFRDGMMISKRIIGQEQVGA